ncbi:hypothetical protein CO665_20715 [Rhizobium anhuiense]|nr:hypothetical protein CO665_20715 [Rhizobium anhuiense]PDS44498.1 hypothetical protein CO668_13270 [Rhizobium anhuiense]PDS57852.1 hypothetical protein CO663_17420 [Rhizobium anhuiense]
MFELRLGKVEGPVQVLEQLQRSLARLLWRGCAPLRGEAERLVMRWTSASRAILAMLLRADRKGR